MIRPEAGVVNCIRMKSILRPPTEKTKSIDSKAHDSKNRKLLKSLNRG